MAIEKESPDAEFLEAANNWNLERLYIDLAAAKGRGLTPLEKKFLQALLCGYSPAEIADRVYQSSDSSAVRVYLCNGIYKYIRELFLQQKGETIQIGNWSRITNLLERAGYKRKLHANLAPIQAEAQKPNSKVRQLVQPPKPRQNWEEKIATEGFVGREIERQELQHWITEARCRLVSIVGLGGLGKTALTVELVEGIQDNFEFTIWRSLRNAPPLEEFLTGLIQFLSLQEDIKLPKGSGAQISLLMNILRSRRILLVFDRLDTLFQSGERSGIYREGYAGYSELLRRIGEESHQSCCILTSREQPQEIALLEGEDASVRTLALKGLCSADALKLSEIQALKGPEAQKRQLVKLYAKNPLVLKRVALTIENCFHSNTTEFLASRIVLNSEVRALLDRQFNRLSPLEQRLLYKLSLMQRSANISGVIPDLTLDVPPHKQLEAVESLQQRMWLEKNSSQFRQQPLLSAYVLETLIDRICAQIGDRQMASLLRQIFYETPIVNNALVEMISSAA